MQYKQALFSAWRIQVQDLKAARISLMLRVWTALQKNKQFQHLRKLQGILLLKTQFHIDDHLLQITFRALKLNKEQEKQRKVSRRLLEEEGPLAEDAAQTIQKARRKAQMVASKRAVKNGILNPFSSVLRSYLKHWREVNKQYKLKLSKNIKDKILKVYKARLADAWTRWN